MSLTDHQKNQLLDAVAHYMGPELRGKIMSELPLAYNAWVGRQIMSVEKLSDAEAEVRAQEANALDEEMFKPHVNVMGYPGETKAQTLRRAGILEHAYVLDRKMSEIPMSKPIPIDIMSAWMKLCREARALGDQNVLNALASVAKRHETLDPNDIRANTIIAEEEDRDN